MHSIVAADGPGTSTLRARTSRPISSGTTMSQLLRTPDGVLAPKYEAAPAAPAAAEATKD
ncbi:hypothetical protein TRAPUB_9547 [Trametes pubescens]|uniref:Uncharacterized protein n=1 Tax=Trametes pubescens TaxID=154538 RepID=A0A1M2W204_TRAPU|nr:hypothetical protein TRAPUB_9547 [Trametes pubescens]